ncbi:MAG: hypothetical protein ACPGSL_03250 [Vicingaceae bacterium]
MNLEKRATKLISEGYDFKLEEYFSKGFEIFKKEYGLFIGFSIIAGIMSIISSLIPFIGSFAQIIISSIANLGFFYVARKIKKGEKPDFEDFFKPFNDFGNIVGVALVVAVLTIIGVLCLIIPGIYLGVAWGFAVPIVYFFRGTELWAAMEASRKIITKNWWWFFLFGFCIGLLNMLGALCLLVGLFITIPVSHLIMYAAFDDIMQPDAIDEAEEVTPPPTDNIIE